MTHVVPRWSITPFLASLASIATQLVFGVPCVLGRHGQPVRGRCPWCRRHLHSWTA